MIPKRADRLRCSHRARKGVAHMVFVALGSNLGDSQANVLTAMDRLQKWTDEPILRSSLRTTAPVDCPPGSPPFVNAVVGLVPRGNETPDSLLKKLQKLERAFGRKTKRILNEPRPLDLDIIAFRNETHASPRLTLPHPRAHLRRFVLEPLSEIAPRLILAGQRLTVAGLLKKLPAEPQARLGSRRDSRLV